jgi:hypothetical protein
MKVKVSKLANAIPSIKFISQQSIPAKVSFRLAKFINAVSEEMDVLEIARRSIFEKYSTVNTEAKENEQSRTIIPELKEKYEKEMLELFNQEVELSIEPIVINELGGISLPVNHLMALDFMFKE